MRLRLWRWWRSLPFNQANSTCNACGYRGIRRGRFKWCPACRDDMNGLLVLDRRAASPEGVE